MTSYLLCPIGAVTINLPDASTTEGRVIRIVDEGGSTQSH